jgi:hypothetical protein
MKLMRLRFRSQKKSPLLNLLSASPLEAQVENAFVCTRLTVIVLKGSFTFTSPSLYLAYATLSAEFLCPFDSGKRPHNPGNMYTASFIPLNAEDLYSVVPYWQQFQGNGEGFARAVAGGSFWDKYGHPDSYRIEQFEVSNLAGPVPASAYYAANDDCWLGIMPCATITDGSYNPWLALKEHVLASLDPAWLTCKQGIRGIHDPPTVLSLLPGKSFSTLSIPTFRSRTTAAAVPVNILSDVSFAASPAASPAAIQTQAAPTRRLSESQPTLLPTATTSVARRLLGDKAGTRKLLALGAFAICFHMTVFA